MDQCVLFDVIITLGPTLLLKILFLLERSIENRERLKSCSSFYSVFLQIIKFIKTPICNCNFVDIRCMYVHYISIVKGVLVSHLQLK